MPGDMPPWFEEFMKQNEEEEQESASKIGSVQSTIEEYSDLRKIVRQIIFGDQPDKLVMAINRVMISADLMRTALLDNGFPQLVIYLVYIPLYGSVSLINLLQEEMLQLIILILLFGLACGLSGGLLSVLFAAFKAYNIYNERFDENGMPRDSKKKEDEDEVHINLPKDPPRSAEPEETKEEAQPKPA